jgi:hypothetical protein
VPPLNQQLMITTAKTRFAKVAPKPPPPAGLRNIAGVGPLARAPRLALRTEPDRGALIEPLCRAICQGHSDWRAQAHFVGIKINGPTATGGTLQGPALGPLIRGHLGTAGAGSSKKYGDAVAAGVGDAWAEFQATFQVPGLAWYPSFVAIPGPQAPPMPNTPTPLIACACDLGKVSASTVKPRMDRYLPGSDPDDARLLQAIAEAFELVVREWVALQQVTNVMGSGPVPTFAPPYVPVGPVVGGDNIPGPGHLMT